MTSVVTLYAIEEERAALLDTIDLVEDEQQKRFQAVEDLHHGY
jgi:hypothetical protein